MRDIGQDMKGLLDPSVMTCQGTHGTFNFTFAIGSIFKTLLFPSFCVKKTRKTLTLEVVQHNQQSTLNQQPQ